MMGTNFITCCFRVPIRIPRLTSMQIAPTIDEDDVEFVPLALPLDRATISWLNAMSRNDVEAAQHIADMIREIREADEAQDRVLN
jgi:predicted nucleic acid-binding protein